MASLAPLLFSPAASSSSSKLLTGSSFLCNFNTRVVPVCCQTQKNRRSLKVVSAVGDVSAEGTNYLIAGAVAVALLGTAFPIVFSRKDVCPECDGAGFVRQSSKILQANAARKDLNQIVCARCNGLGKLGQIDKQ
ncbi:hypothetical protein IFM89_000622 [Coptis chinensis]|uniref:Uncharacterized protein n=1 Tax=Coptis chinensis TaxID=261450 RepID=A0A835HBP7_9MAGN|nr:hypothetical protein IFM89_000622 [Coptis chinensis]